MGNGKVVFCILLTCAEFMKICYRLCDDDFMKEVTIEYEVDKDNIDDIDDETIERLMQCQYDLINNLTERLLSKYNVSAMTHGSCCYIDTEFPFAIGVEAYDSLYKGYASCKLILPSREEKQYVKTFAKKFFPSKNIELYLMSSDCDSCT